MKIKLMRSKLSHCYVARLLQKKQCNNITIYQSKSAFTLIELLVVIAIIGVLAALATVTYSDSQQKSRDSRRKADLEAIRKAMELAKQDSAGSYTYPSCDTGSSCTVTDTTGSSSSTDSGGVVPDLIGTNYSYIKAVPTDPKSGTAYAYSTFASDGTTACSGAATCVTFKLVACLENAKDPQKDSPSAGCTSPLVSYTISNL